MSKITVLTLIDRLSCFHSLMPFLLYGGRGRFTFTDSAEYCLNEDRNRILVLVRQFIKPDKVDVGLLAKLRAKYDRIAFFHDDAGGGIPRLEAISYVDLFYTKALFKDRSLYGKSLYGKELYSDYYHTKYGVIDPDHRERFTVSDTAELEKLRLSWNVGVGDYPRGKFRQRLGTAAARALGVPAARWFYVRGGLKSPKTITRKIPVHARIGLTNRPSISYQRSLILEQIGTDARFLTGSVGQRAYNAEVAASRIVLSPFGWGELCLRDFEAVRAGALLLKPDMSHLETWPDVFKPGETYAPFSWDADDLLPVVDRYLSDEAERRRITDQAYQTYQDQLADLEARFELTIAEIEGKTPRRNG